MLTKLLKIYKKNKEVINYIIVGGLTTLISIATYFLFAKFFHIDYIVSTILSWVISVTFAYITNKIYVFESKNNKFIKEIIDFFKYRLLSLLIEVVIMYMFVELVKMDDGLAKIIVQVIVFVLNYLFSKLFVFKK